MNTDFIIDASLPHEEWTIETKREGGKKFSEIHLNKQPFLRFPDNARQSLLMLMQANIVSTLNNYARCQVPVIQKGDTFLWCVYENKIYYRNNHIADLLECKDLSAEMQKKRLQRFLMVMNFHDNRER